MKQCKCGNDRKSPLVKAEASYSAAGWLALVFGASAVPKKVVFRCSKCGEAFDETTDPVELKTHV